MTSGATFLLTLLLLVQPGDATLRPLDRLLFGYSVSLAGAFIGALWAYAYGVLLAGAVAFAYNLAVAPPLPPPPD